MEGTRPVGKKTQGKHKSRENKTPIHQEMREMKQTANNTLPGLSPSHHTNEEDSRVQAFHRAVVGLGKRDPCFRQAQPHMA